MYVVKKCISNELYIFACQNNNFISLNQLDVTYHKANKTVCEFVSTKGCNALICFFQEYHLVHQFVYSVLLPKFIMLNQIRSQFMIHYKNWLGSKRKRTNNEVTIPTITTTKTPNNLGKNPADYITKQSQKFVNLDRSNQRRW